MTGRSEDGSEREADVVDVVAQVAGTLGGGFLSVAAVSAVVLAGYGTAAASAVLFSPAAPAAVAAVVTAGGWFGRKLSGLAINRVRRP